VFLRRLTIALAVLWALTEIFINLKQAKSARVKNRKDRGSLLLIYAAVTAGFYLGAPMSSECGAGSLSLIPTSRSAGWFS